MTPSLVTYSAPNIRPTGPAAFASLRSYYFRMSVANYRQRQIEACESQDCSPDQLREFFRVAGTLAKMDPFYQS